MTDHPPKPRLTLRVGVTGHRPNKMWEHYLHKGRTAGVL